LFQRVIDGPGRQYGEWTDWHGDHHQHGRRILAFLACRAAFRRGSCAARAWNTPDRKEGDVGGLLGEGSLFVSNPSGNFMLNQAVYFQDSRPQAR
jgi:hypothetical protein